MSISFLADIRGEVAALSAALIWAIASVVYAGVGRQLSPLMLNLVKGLIAIAFLLVALLLTGKLFPAVNLGEFGLLALSGAIGIGFGDTVYFQALNFLGARRALILESLAPPIAALLALVFLQEQLSTIAWCGITLTVIGVTWVVIERAPLPANENPTLSMADRPFHPNFRSAHFTTGIGFGLLAAIAQATGVVLSRAALSGTDIDPLWSTLVRLVAGVLALLIWLVAKRHSIVELKPLRNQNLLLTVAATAFASTFLAIWLQQTAVKYTAAGIAQALSATSPLFVIPIAIGLGEKVSPGAILGVLVALAGIWLLLG